ncbi:PREDICTED: uncharacterized protein LOC106742695 isoform X2 [Dinoponera quadriceps]|uniref:Uncharacterized protein LOC106742695 isoform X2 n=1 Tax=Dinoponera quadriceps TaxID=609295 RepID=A0A6P3WZ62_DINQU|nr:PREDICTED: uncharacterized protein LOC106742695 isoform X2 [Dinoponera quadriceps]
MYALIDNKRSPSTNYRQSNGEMTDTRKRKSHDNDDVSTKGPVINNNGGQTRNKKINNKWNKNHSDASIPRKRRHRQQLRQGNLALSNRLEKLPRARIKRDVESTRQWQKC